MAVYGLHWSKYVSILHTRKMEKYSGIFGKDYSNKNRKCNEAWRHSRDLSTTSSKPRAAIVFDEYLEFVSVSAGNRCRMGNLLPDDTQIMNLNFENSK